jgi:hypothetical protein
MKPKMSAAQLEARRKAGLSTSIPTHACSGALSNANTDCEEKRDPDIRSLIIQKKKNELDPDTQLEKLTFAAVSAKVRYAGRSCHTLRLRQCLRGASSIATAKGMCKRSSPVK